MVNTRLLTRSDVERLLDLPSCIEAVEHAFRLAAQGALQPSAIMGIPAPTGSFHIKAASLPAPLTSHLSPLTAVKVNANFPANPALSGFPTIQGLLLLFDAATGAPLAVMDSIALTILRTAAATGIAARHLAAPGARTVAVAGCGAQASAQLAAVCLVRPIQRAVVVDSDPAVAHEFARAAALRMGIPVTVAAGFSEAAAASDIVITCTTSRRAFLGAGDVSPGAFIAAVGADSEHKQELEPALLAASVVIADSIAQCAAIGDLHHAIAAGVMGPGDVRAELADVVVDPARGRRDPREIVIFDSTGVALEDVAAAALVYQRAVAEGAGASLCFGA